MMPLNFLVVFVMLLALMMCLVSEQTLTMELSSARGFGLSTGI